MSFASAEAAYHDDGGDPHEGYVHEDRAEELFTAGLQAMRELLARVVDQGCDKGLAESLRLIWLPSWGKDPGRPDEIATDCWGV